ncbi:acyl-CoA dehydrogenase family protein [Conexibacter sp. CPCC 206217]|uniref:acyl-CoA dehydrogenase family protein n=1 Tax=Conexibacter sp. CPCC 206217 TaxID=3064574 RepID=UPI0027161139|nr:acyl-CoA dehydrogenase family protein [Conexibacter sp. CPCC 206217]MDO8211674.1 acyl-CoA dehydrogenase family protein [Conexibacter sp. CPCC 206217]
MTDIPSGIESVELVRLLEEIAAGAAERERLRIAPHEQIRQLGRAGLGALRVPRAHGGAERSLRDLFAFVIRLAAADSNIAQSLRAHYHFVEGRLASADQAQRDRWLPEVVRGTIFGNATVERTTRDIFGFETTLTPSANGDGSHVLSGTKYYSTGSLYADRVTVAAMLPDGSVGSAIVPADRDGVTLEDDWDGMGQRLTASGTSRFEDVLVAADELLPSPIGRAAAAPRSAFLQLYLVAVMAGIVRNAATDAARMARERRRTFSHASGELPRVDPLVQQVVGRIASDAFACEAVVLAAAAGLDAAAASAGSTADGAPDPDAVHEGALLTAQAQVVVAELAPRAAELLFDAGGASATSREQNLDRHWRNARTIASHNTAMYKARAIGDLLINEERLPTNGFF